MNDNFQKLLNATFVNNKQTTNKTLFVFAILSAAIIFSMPETSLSFAETNTTVNLDDEMLLQKTVVMMNVPESNVLPWAAVTGTVDDPAHGYPVIIQFFSKEGGDDPIHVAQVDIKEDDTYEYKFRIRNMGMDTGKVINIFEGDYAVKIFKVVNAPHKEPDSA